MRITERGFVVFGSLGVLATVFVGLHFPDIAAWFYSLFF